MRSKNLRRPRSTSSIYIDDTPAGDQTYDPYGTSRPFRPTHKTAAQRQQKPTSYLDIERRTSGSRPAENPVLKVASALKQTVAYKFEDSNPFEKLRVAGYGTAGVIGAICVLVLGTTILHAAFPYDKIGNHGESVAAQTAAATQDATTDKDGNTVSAKIGKPSASGSIAETPVVQDGQVGMPMVEGIADSTMALYVKAAQTCKMPWQILAAVGRVETNHGESDAPGVNDGQNSAGAMGPMQFMKATWDKYGLDANHDGKADVYDQTDAVYSAASYLCANGANTSSGIDNALYHYNHSNSYVQLVRQTAASYYDSSYRAPLPPDAVSNGDLGKRHHDYPADDIPVDQGTPVFAVHKGTIHRINNGLCGYGIELQGTDGVTYTYCHASQIHVNDGANVDAGALIMHSGGTPGTAGAGDATGPHLHFQIEVNGNNVCPQGLLQKWEAGQFTSPMNQSVSGCVS